MAVFYRLLFAFRSWWALTDILSFRCQWCTLTFLRSCSVEVFANFINIREDKIYLLMQPRMVEMIQCNKYNSYYWKQYLNYTVTNTKVTIASQLQSTTAFWPHQYQITVFVYLMAHLFKWLAYCCYLTVKSLGLYLQLVDCRFVVVTITLPRTLMCTVTLNARFKK